MNLPSCPAGTESAINLDRLFVRHRRGSRARILAAFTAVAFAGAAMGLFASSGPAKAQCTSGGPGIENCSGAIPSPVDFGAPSINTLNVTNPTNSTSFVRLQGASSAPANGNNGNFTCGAVPSGPNAGDALCTITTNPDQSQSCAPQTNADGPQGVCQAGTTSGGPSGNTGPTVTVKVTAPTSGPVQIGVGRGGTPAVTGISQGSKGGDGGNS